MDSTISDSDMQVSSEDVGSKGNIQSKSPSAVCSSDVSKPITPNLISERRRLRGMNLWTVRFRGFGPSATVPELRELFGQAGEIELLEIFHHIYVGFGRIMYRQREHAKQALELFDYSVYKGKLIRVYSTELNTREKELDIMRKKDVRCRKVVFKRINSSIDESDLQYLGEMFGTVTSCKVYKELLQGYGDAHGVVEFEKEGVATELIQKLDGSLFDGMKLEISPFDPEEEDNKREKLRRTVVVSNLSENFYQLQKYFFQFGYITGMFLDMDEDGHSKGVGFVSYMTVEAADSAVKKMNGYEHDNKVWSVKKFPMNFEQERSRKLEHLQYGCIQVNNLHGFVSDEPLREMFSEFGPISFCKVRLDSQGQCTGTGIVEFHTPADATRAVNAMNGKVIVGKPLGVSLIEHKDQKRARLEVAKVCGAEIHTPVSIPVNVRVDSCSSQLLAVGQLMEQYHAHRAKKLHLSPVCAEKIGPLEASRIIFTN